MLVPEYLQEAVTKEKQEIIEGYTSVTEMIPDLSIEDYLAQLRKDYRCAVAYHNGLRPSDLPGLSDDRKVKFLALKAAIKHFEAVLHEIL